MSRGVQRSRNEEICQAAGGGAGTGGSAGSDDPSSRRTTGSHVYPTGGPVQAPMDGLQDGASLLPRNCSSWTDGEPGAGSLGRRWWCLRRRRRRQRLCCCR